MYSTPELVAALQEERDRIVREGRLARIAASARRCCAAPPGLMSRLIRLARPAAGAC